MPTTVLHLEFDPPIRGDERVDLFVHALKENFPGIRWANHNDIIPTEKNINSHKTLVVMMDYNNFSPYSLLFSEHSVRPNELAHVLNVEPIPVTDGWKWIEEKSVDYDETSDLFGQLDEQALREESLDKKITYLIEKDINIEWDTMVKILKEYFGENVSWTGRQDISKVPTVGNNWQTLAIKYDNFYNRFLVNFGRDKPQRYFELYPEHELIKVSEVSTDIDNTSNLFNQLNESTGNRINKYKVGDKFYCKEDLRFNDVLKDRFATKGHTYEIIKIEPDYDWYEYGYKGNRYVFLLDGEKPEDANHGFSDRYIDKNFIYIPEGSDIDIDYDKLYEGYWDDLYKSKRYTQKFGIGDRVIMNGTVGGKTLTNELGTVLKFKNTGGGTGHPHRVYLILFDNWSDTKMNFLMSSVQADQNRDFTDHRCGEGRCWYSTSDYLEPAPDSNEMFNTLNESEDLDWTNDIVDSNSNFEPQDGEWIVVDTGQHYPWNPDMWQYFEIPGFNECFEGETSYGMINANRECIDDLYARGILVHPRRDDICYVNKKVWTKVTTFSKKLPVYHCIRKSDGGHFLVASKGVEPFSSQ